MPSRSIEGPAAPAGLPGVGAALVVSTISAAFAAAIAWPWGAVAMVSAGLGALGAGAALALRGLSGGAGGAVAPPIPAPDAALPDLGELPAEQMLMIDRTLDDLAASAAIARHLADGPRGRIVAEIRDPALRRAMRQRFEADRVEPRPILFDTGTLLARTAIGRERLYDQAYWRDQPRVHAVVVGFGGIGRACFEEVVLAGIAGQLAPPRITVADPNPDIVEAAIRAEMPEIGRSADIVVVRYDPATFTDPEDGALVAADRMSPLTVILVCLPDERARVQVLGAVAGLQRRHARGLAPIIVLSEQGSPATLLARPIVNDRDMGRRIVVDASALEGDAVLDALMVDDEAARHLHDAYRSDFGEEQASGRPWEALGETYRSSSRAAARHLRQKLWTTGLTCPGLSEDAGHVEPGAFVSIVAPCVTGSGEDALMRRLARLEHDRWCADRRLDGWSYGVARDEDRRLHPSLVSFDDPRLSDAEIAKDIAQVRFLFRAVVRAHPDGASAPLVIGITARQGEGIPVSDALALIEGQTSRPVILLSTLGERREAATTRRLVHALRDAKRPFRLLVPEFRAVPRAVDPLRDLPESLIVPVAACPSEACDEWEDPAMEGEIGEAVARYLAVRCTAVVAAPAIETAAP